MSRGKHVPVSQRALIQRINRILAKDREVLKVTRGTRASLDLGDCYVLDANRNVVVRKMNFVELEPYARELGALQPYERLNGRKP